jgi:transcriptional regulator with XRE-family HTH domain
MSTQTAATAEPFGAALRRWRARRRVSQLELATRADTTQRHISFIEQGRSHPGRAIVIRLSESLELTLRERNALLLCAGFAPAFCESSLDSPMLAPTRKALEQVIEGHLPYPAFVLRRPAQVIAANRAVAVLLEGSDPKLFAPPFNILRVMLHPDGMAPYVANLGQWGQHVINNIRAAALSSPDQRLDELAAELEGYLPPYIPGPDHLGFSVPLRLIRPEGELRLLTALTSFATAVDVTLAEVMLESFLPGDADTARILTDRDRQAAERGEPRLWSARPAA